MSLLWQSCVVAWHRKNGGMGRGGEGMWVGGYYVPFVSRLARFNECEVEYMYFPFRFLRFLG